MREKLRDWYTIHIVPVLPYVRLRSRQTIVTAVLLGTVFLSLQLTTLVAVVSKNIEDADASSYTVHLICHDLREEQVQVLQDT